MTAIIALVLFIIVFAALGIYTRRSTSNNVRVGTISDDVWAEAAESVKGSVMARAVVLGKPFANLPFVWDEESSLHRTLRRKLLAAGSMYGGSPQVFLSIQVAAGLLSLVVIALGISGLFPAFPAVIIAAVILLYPFAQVEQRGRRRTEEINNALPEFSEMLMMPIAAGQGVLSSLRVCADNIESPVADQVNIALNMIAAGNVDVAAVFREGGDRLGTPEARSFFSALQTAYIEGDRVLSILQSQSDSLRKSLYQRRRAEAKRLPVKLIMIFGLHLLPLLFIIAGIPVISALSGL